MKMFNFLRKNGGQEEVADKPKKAMRNIKQLLSDGWHPSNAERYLKYKLHVDGDPDAVTEEMIHEAISNTESFDVAIKYWEYNSFNENSECGKKIIAKLMEFAENRAKKCHTFQEAYNVLFYDLIHRSYKFDFYTIFRRRAYELVEKQVASAEKEGDLEKLANLLECARKVDYHFSNFSSKVDGSIRRLVDVTVEHCDSADLLNFYVEAREYKCDLIDNMICSAIAEDMLKKSKE